MTQGRYITDETLVAFLDRELSPEDAAVVTEELSKSPELNERLSALDAPVSDLREGASGLIAMAPDFPEHLIAKTPTDWMRAVGMFAILAIGLGAAFTFWPRSEQNWIKAVANYQSLYVTQTLERSEPIDQRQTTLLGLSEDIGLDLSALVDIKDVDYRRAQLLGFEGKPLVQVAYLDNQVPIAICITFVEGPDQSPEVGTYFGLSAVSWQKEGRGFLVIGGQDNGLLQQIADQVREKT